MPGVPGAGGPPPKRESQRRRANKPEVPVEIAVDGDPLVADPDPDWHPIARMMWDGLRSSGQSVFYASSDWATAFALCESMSREFAAQPVVTGPSDDKQVEWVKFPPKAAALASWSKMLAGLMATEGDRRRLRLELVRQGAEEATTSDDVSHLDEYRRRVESR